MFNLILTIIIILITSTSEAQIIHGGRGGGAGGGGGSGQASSIINSTTLPATCTVAGIYFDTDEEQNQRVNVCTATDTWAPLLEAEVDTLQTVVSRGREVTTAVSEATGVQIGDGTNKVTRYWDATGGAYDKPSPLGDSLWRIWTNFDGCVYDEEGAAKMFCYDPDAATPRAKYLFKTGYYPLKSVYLPAGFWDGDGTQCPALATTVTINSGPKLPTFICADNSGSTLYAALTLPPDYVAGTTLAFTQRVIQTAADTGSLNGDISAQCRGNGETPSSTWGTAIALDDAALTGSNANDFITSAAVTPAGTCNPGDSLYLRYVFDSASTTASASLHFVGFDMTYSSESLSH